MGTAYQHTDWKDWFEHHGPKLYLFARQQTRSSADAEDVLQDAFVRIWKQSISAGSVRPALFYQAIRRSAIDLARREDRRQRREQLVANDPASTRLGHFKRSLEVEERQSMLEDALSELSDEQREVVYLRIWGELTFEEVGETLDISPNTAASRYRYGLEHLRKHLNPSLL